jgi:tRNA (guanine-N7-)-methyltransferase
MSHQLPPQRTFGRVKGRPLPQRPFDPLDLAPQAREIWLEVGFGAGEHLVGQAARHPDVCILGAEPFVNGFAACLARIEDAGVANARIHLGDARDVMARLPAASVSRIFVLFPDPWPKARHRKRRLVEPGFIAEAARLLKPGARIRLATDWADYADWALQRFLANPAFRWTADRADDWRTPPADHVSTRYERKRLGDTPPIWLEFERR